MTDLTKIPSIGKTMARHLTRAGYPDIESLKGIPCGAQATGSCRRANRTGGIGRSDLFGY